MVHDYDRDLQHMRKELKRIREQINHGRDDEVVAWLMNGEIAGAHRPLRYDPTFGGRVAAMSPEARPALDRWLAIVIADGIRSVICLATDQELKRYDSLELGAGGLLGWLERGDITIRHVPLRDPAHLPEDSRGSWKLTELPRAQRKAADAFSDLAPPVLLFCSGGADRTPPVAAYIVQHLDQQ